MAINSEKMTRWAWDTKLTNLATATTLGSATRYETEVQTLYAPETTRAFSRVLLRVTFRDASTTAADVDGVRLGIKINAVSWSDTDLTVALAHTGDPYHLEYELDVTSYFATNDPGTASFSIQAALAVAQSAASNINNATFELFATYRYDDSASTHADFASFLIQSHVDRINSAATYVEVGTTGGTADAPANQIRQLTGTGGAFDGVTGFTLRKRYLKIFYRDGNGGTSNHTATYRFDGGGTTYPRATIEQTLNNNCPGQDIFDITSLSTSAAHSWEVSTDVASRYQYIGAEDVVVYEYTASSSVGVVTVMLPLTCIGTDVPSQAVITSSEKERQSCVLDVQEPGTITLDRCGVIMTHGYVATATHNIAATGQTAQPYVGFNSADAGNARIVHRCDHNSADWSLARGRNVLSVDHYQSVYTNNYYGHSALAVITYLCSKPAGGWSRKNRTIYAGQITSYVEKGNSSSSPWNIASKAIAIEEANYALSGALATYLFTGTAKVRLAIGAERAAADDPGSGWWRWTRAMQGGFSELSCDVEFFDVGSVWRRWQDGAGGNIESSHRWYSSHEAPNAAVNPAHQVALWLTYHAITFSLTGTVTINGAAAASKVDKISIYAVDGDGIGELMSNTVDTDTNGDFAFTAPDNTRSYVAVYDDGTARGCSVLGTPGTDDFDITIGGATDETEPTVAAVTVEGSLGADFETATVAPIVVDITDETSLAYTAVWACFGSTPATLTKECVYRRGDFEPGYATNSTESAISGGIRLSIRRDDGWPPGTVNIVIDPVDGGGNLDVE